MCNDHYLIPELSITPKGKLIFLRIIFLYGFVQRRQWHPTPVLLPGKSHGQRSLVGCSPWGRKESDTTERLHFHFSLSCIGEGNGNPLQCSCLENPRDGEPGGLPSMRSHRVGHDWSDLAAAAWICLLYIFHINVIIQYVVFCVCFLSFIIIFSKFIHPTLCFV